MKITSQCKQCGKKYSINLNNVQSKLIKFTCQDCQTENILANPQYGATDISNGQEAGTRFLVDKRRGFSLRSKIILIFVLLVLVSLSIVGWVASNKSRNALMAQTVTSLKLTTSQKAEAYGHIFDRIADEAVGVADYAKMTYGRKDLSTNLGLRVLMPWTGSGYGNDALRKKLNGEYLGIQRIGNVLKSMVSKNPYLSLGYLGTETQITVFNDESVVDVIEEIKGFNVTGRPWYQKAKQVGKTIWTEPYIDANSKKLTVTCATPVYNAGNRLIGVVGFDVLLETIQKDILALDIGYKSYALLVDNKGSALVRPGMQKGDARWDETYNTTNLLSTSNPGFNNIVKNMVAGRSDVETYHTEEGEKYVAYTSLPMIGASMAIVASKDEVVEPAVAIQNFILIVWLIVLVFAIAAGFFVGNGITKPIKKLTDVADQISQGKMDLDVLPENRKDEIGQLTQAFNRLITSLKIAMEV